MHLNSLGVSQTDAPKPCEDYNKPVGDTESPSDVDPAGPGWCGIMNTHGSTDTSPLQSFIPTFRFSSPGGGTIHS